MPAAPDSHADTVSRYDVAALGNAERTPQGFLRIPAHVTRTGILEYKRADGTTVRELRPADEVFKAQSLATLRAAPVTDLHPTEMISPANVRKLSIGHLSEDVRADGELVATAITVQEADAIAAVEKGERRELSCGYRCRIDATPGTYRGQKYDQVQRDIVYNHVALGPRNWGRAGRDVALRIDGAADDAASDATVFRLDAADALSVQPSAASSHRKKVTMDMTTIDLDGKHVEVSRDAATHILNVIALRTDALGEVVIERDERDVTIAEQKERIDSLEAALRDATDPKRIAGYVRARAAVLDKARTVLEVDDKFDSMSDREIQEAYITAVNPAFKVQDRTDEQIAAAFDALDGGTRQDSAGGVSPIAAARGAMQPLPRAKPAERQDAKPWVPDWRKPLAFTAPDYKG